jgi:hypothetical protein
MRLMKVRDDRHLYYPDSFPRDEQYRGGPGYVVDMDAPFEADWCKGQEYKLIEADPKSKASPIESNHGIRIIKDASQRVAAKPAASESVKSKPLPAVDAFARK